MEITYLGNSAFRIKSKKAIVLVGADSGLSSGITADIVCVLEDGNLKKGSVKPALKEEVLVLDEPGEYEISGVGIFGVDLSNQGKRNVGFIFEIEKLRIAHLGNLSKTLTEKQIQEINGVDVLLIPVGGGEVITPDEALGLINSIEPSVVIPMSYSSSKNILKLENSLEEFLKTVGMETAKSLDKLVLSSKETDTDQVKKIVVLKDRSK